VFFKQIQQHSDNFSYIIADESTKEAAVVDSSFNAEEIIKIIKTQKLHLTYILNTHGHSDHTAGNTELVSIFGAKVAAHKLAKISYDIPLEDNEVLRIGKISIKILYTPGHTLDSICLLLNNQKLLTGDTLFVGECGRTDFVGGSSKNMYESLFYKLLTLDDNVEVYPGHDYGKEDKLHLATKKPQRFHGIHESTLTRFLLGINAIIIRTAINSTTIAKISGWIKISNIKINV
jgi:hydroxyacylglutathione hydrolase